jgi:hypothetical protein
MTPRAWAERFQAEDLMEAAHAEPDGKPRPFANWLALFEPLVLPLDASVLAGAKLPDLSSEIIPPHPRKLTNEALSQAFKVRVDLPPNIAPEDLLNRAMNAVFHLVSGLPDLQKTEKVAQISRIVKKELDAWPDYIARFKNADVQQVEAAVIHKERTRCLDLIRRRDEYVQRIGNIANEWYREGLKDVLQIISARG